MGKKTTNKSLNMDSITYISFLEDNINIYEKRETLLSKQLKKLWRENEKLKKELAQFRSSNQ